MSLRSALVFGLVCAGIGLGIGLWFVSKVGWVLLPLILVTDIVLTVIAAIKASEGESYRYPMTLRLIK